jgi:regulator of nucleoside diphosphate kinase
VQATAPAERTLTLIDHIRLTRLLGRLCSAKEPAQAMHDLLESSELVPARAVPRTVVTMDSHVLLQDPAADAPAYQVTLCYPESAEPRRGFVSVLSPVGSALIGRREGETATWAGPSGRHGAARIVQVLFQPEANGDYEP